MKCKICQSQTTALFPSKITVLDKYPVEYFKCSSCGFIQTEDPYWLDEAYSSAITSLDIGLVSRNQRISQQLHSLITLLFDKKSTYLDYGGGYGMLVRMMRDIGYDFYRYDTYCANLFSLHFDLADTSERKFELITAFELFEHLLNPIEETEKMLELGDSIFFSTELIPDHQINKPEDWWYFIPETGQHISLYSAQSLKKLAEHFKCNFYTDNKSLHLITKRKINPTYFKLALKIKVSNLVSKLSKQQSLLLTDLNYIRNVVKQNQE